MPNIPQWPVAREREMELLREVLAEGQWGGFSEMVARFEQEFAAYQQCTFGISAANGTLTLELMLAVAGIGPGDEVIVPAISFIATATAVSRAGAAPVFVDIEPYSFNIDPERVREAISPRTKAILAVHFGGAMANVDALSAIAAEHGLLLLEDAAHAHGSEWRGRRAGSFGLASSFSFQNGKVMTAGEGGAVLTCDAEFAARARSLANGGRRPGYSFFHHFEIASNLRMSGLQAAVLMAQLERLDEQIALRARNWRILRDVNFEGLTWQSVHKANNRQSYYLMLGRIARGRDKYHRRLTEMGIPCTPFYPHTLYRNPAYQHSPCRVLPCPVAEACIRDAFWLPFRVLMTSEEETRAIAAALENAGRS